MYMGSESPALGNALVEVSPILPHFTSSPYPLFEHHILGELQCHKTGLIQGRLFLGVQTAVRSNRDVGGGRELLCFLPHSPCTRLA